MKAAEDSWQRGDFAAAVRAYEGVLARDPRNYEAAYLMAVSLYKGGQLERAARAFAAVAKLDPRRYEPHKDRGLILMKLADYEQAAQSFERAFSLSPQSADLILNRGIALKNCDRLEEAIACYRQAIELRPDFAQAHNNLANGLSLLGRKDEALASYEDAYRLQPDYADAYVNAADLLQDLNRLDDARNLLGACLARHPEHAGARRSLAHCLFALGQIAEAEAAASRAIEVNPEEVEARLLRAEILAGIKRDDEAIEDFTAVLERHPRHVRALVGKSKLLWKRSRHDEVITLCRIAIAAEPENARPYYWIGRAFHGSNELLAAIKSFEKAAELDPDWLSPKLRRADALMEFNADEEALSAFEQLAVTHPGEVRIWFGRAETLRKLRRQEEALTCLAEALALVPENAHGYKTRASVMAELGRLEESLADHARSLTLLASGDKLAEATVEDCLRLLAVDYIPAIYKTEAELNDTRQRLEVTLDQLMAQYEHWSPRNPTEALVAREALFRTNGFYLAYHQRNDRETMAKLSRIGTRLLAIAPFEPKPRAGRLGPIRIGIASQSLMNHNGANWAYNWFANLPGNEYEFFTYSFGSSDDSIGRKFAKLGTHRDCTTWYSNPGDVLRQMREDELDYLMLPDVGMTVVSRFLALHRIAPRQFTAWGHPVTTGSAEMDFYLSSDLMEPPDAQDHYTEKLVRMPNLALYLDEEEVTEAASRPADFGLPEGRILFGCLQSLFKYLPRYDEILPRVALDVPEALFVFLEGNPPYMTAVLKERLAASFADHGLDWQNHVVVLPRQRPGSFDRLMRTMDVCIDSVGWSGGNTTLRNIRFGVPLATVEGEFMRGRHSSAMFRMIGAEDMIAADVDSYVRLLVRLGRDESYRQHCRETFLNNRHRLYRDSSFIAAFDGFLKSNVKL